MSRLGSIAAVLRLRSASRVSALIAECDRDLGHHATLQTAVDRCLDLLRRDLVPAPLSHREFYPGTPSYTRI
jgi:hypothetical protein